MSNSITNDSIDLLALRRVAKAAEAFVEKFDLVEPMINDIFAVQQVRTGRIYSGPQYGYELADLRIALNDARKDLTKTD